MNTNCAYCMKMVCLGNYILLK